MADKAGGKSYRKERERKKSLGKKTSSGASDADVSPPTKKQAQPAVSSATSGPDAGPAIPEMSLIEKDALEREQLEKEKEKIEKEKEKIEKEKEERERLEKEQREREEQEKEQQEREQLDLYMQESQARLNWKQSLRSANIEAAANRWAFLF